MATWSTKRRLIYGFSLLVVISIVIIVPLFKILYKAPTCFDGKKNGDELDMDCGGSCKRLCQSAFLSPRIEWGNAKLEKLANGLYNASSYIVNPNINGGAINVPYKISLYDADGVLIVERGGKVNLYPRRNALAFETAIKVNNSIPVRATFEFTQSPMWFKANDDLSGISVLNKDYREERDSSTLEVTLENKTLYPYSNLLLSAVLYDINDNVIGFSRTKIDKINKNSQETIFFTWPFSRDNKVVKEEILINVIPK